MNHNNDDNDHNKNCKCKLLPLSLSTTTAAEYGDLASLTHRLKNRKKKSQNIFLLPRRTNNVDTSFGTFTTKSNNSHDASLSSNNTKQPITGITTNTSTPLHLAAQNGHAAITSYLLQNGYHADLGYHHSSTNLLKSELSQQAHHHHPQMNRIATPLHRACYSGALSCIKLLLDNGADDMAIDYSMGDEMTPLHKAVKGGRYFAVALLIQHFQEKQLSSSSSSSSSSSTIRSNSSKVMAKSESESESKNDIIHDAKYCNCLQHALDAKDRQNRTPLELARELLTYGEEEILSLRRWDAVAGDTRADFRQCILLLESATAAVLQEQEQQQRQQQQILIKTHQKRQSIFIMEKNNDVSTDIEVCRMIPTHPSSNNNTSSSSLPLLPSSSIFNKKPSSSSSSSISILNSKFAPLCNCENVDDNDDDDQCKTLVWEKAFNKALFDSTSALLNASTGTNHDRNEKKKETDIHLQQHQQQTDVKESHSIQMKQNEKTTTDHEIKECPMECSTGVNIDMVANMMSGCSNEDSNKVIVLGRQCQSCSVHTISLFRSRDGRFVCRKCVKHTMV